MSSPSAIERLAFTLPRFTRVAWVSDRARETWKPRLAKIGMAWSWIEWLGIPAGIRACAVTRLSPEAYVSAAGIWAAEGLSSVPLEAVTEKAARGSSAGPRTMLTVAVGAFPDLQRFKNAWQTHDDDTLGALLGYPPCCRQFFKQTQVDKLLDPTWAIAARTIGLTSSDLTIEIAPSRFANILWRWMGVRPVAHVPCRFDCAETIRLGERYRALGVAAGARQEMEWSDEVLSWPVEWSALHGIAEVKTPILRLSTRTDATAQKYIVQWKGLGYPAEGARGINFPYAAPPRLHATATEAFQQGLKNVSLTRPARPDWYHLDNGFSSRQTMEKQHAPMVTLARQQLAGVSGMILDLGCGNGALLRSICAGHADLMPCGVDVNEAALGHAHEMLPAAAANFSRRNIFEPDVWSADRRYTLAILSLRRLIETSPDRAAALLAAIRDHCDRLIVYHYSDATQDTLHVAAARAGLQLTEVVDGVAASVSLTQQARTATSARVSDPVAPVAARKSSPHLGEGQIDWARMACPQADGYDTEMVLRLSEGNQSRAGSPPKGTLFGGRVSVVNRGEGGLHGPQFAPAPCDHPNLAQAAAYLQAWPEVAEQFPRLITTIQPWNDDSKTPEQWQEAPGSSSHSLEGEFGTIMVTVDSAMGLANAMVHEMAHHKLRALGVSILSASRLIINDPSEQHFSPIKNRNRPVTAILHAQYSFIHVVCLECALHSGDYLSAEQKRSGRARFAWHVSSMERGYREVEQYTRTDRDGAIFLAAFLEWSRAVLDRARSILADVPA